MRIISLFVGLAFCTVAQAATPNLVLEGFTEVDAKRVDKAWVPPGAEFTSYTKVMIDPEQVAFRKNWMRDINRTGGVCPGFQRHGWVCQRSMECDRPDLEVQGRRTDNAGRQGRRRGDVAVGPSLRRA